jgi:hypothetical protein
VGGGEATRLQWSGAQLVVAVFDDWETLHPVLVWMESDKAASRPATLLYARNDVPPEVLGSSLLKHTTELRFKRPLQRIACTKGELAKALFERSVKGASTLADALDDWLGSTQAKQLETHLESGHVVLCVELRTSEDLSVVCGRLARASPHLIELSNVSLDS